MKPKSNAGFNPIPDKGHANMEVVVKNFIGSAFYQVKDPNAFA